MSRVVFKTVTACPQKAERLIQVGLVVATSILSAQLNASPKEVADQACGCGDTNILSCNVILQTLAAFVSEHPEGLESCELTCLWVDRQFSALINWSTKPSIILTSVDVIGILPFKLAERL